jgi:uncharacterized membrane protein YqaE (UPF0057 family)
MLYFLAIVFPPLAVFLTGRIFSALLNVLLCLCLWLPGVIHAIAVVNDYKNQRRLDKLARRMGAT